LIHDSGYKLLFSQKNVIVSLLHYFLHDSWREGIDFDSLEKVNSSYVTKKLRKKESDLIWKIKFQDEYFYLYFLMEFQSRVDNFMAIRLMSYLGLFYEDLIRTQKPKHLPPVLPWVIYNGNAKWNAATHSADLLHPQIPEDLKHYFPSFRYQLLDMGRYPLPAIDCAGHQEPANLLIPLIAFEQRVQNREDAAEHVKHLFDTHKDPEYTEYSKTFAIYIAHVLELKNMPDIQAMLENPQENSQMWYERVKQSDKETWNQAMQIGLQEGKAEGEARGKTQGEHIGIFKSVDLVISQRFKKNPPSLRKALESADDALLEECLKYSLVAKSLEDLAEHLGFSLEETPKAAPKKGRKISQKIKS
jgi:predicted transposase/invertase (TIGR01784 family)